MRMGRKVIFLDIDGTLTEPGSNVPPRTAQQAIREAREAGHRVFLCTGRNYEMLSPLLQYGFDGVVASAGGYIRYQDQVVYDCPMTEEQRQTAMEILKEHGIYRTVECLDGSYTDEEFKEFLRDHAGEGGNSELLRWREQIEKSLNILPMKAYQGQPVYKIVIMSPSREQLEEPRRVLADSFEFCIQEGQNQGFINGEVINRKFDKGRAVMRVCRYLGVPLKDSVAVGDSMNDKEMLQTAGISICMENGSEKLKEIADDICPSVGQDGIWKAFRKHGLMGNSG